MLSGDIRWCIRRTASSSSGLACLISTVVPSISSAYTPSGGSAPPSVGSGWQDWLMPTHVALLRGINVGGGGKLAMADLRQLVTSLGHADVATYIQSGNVVFTPPSGDSVMLSRELRAAIAETLGVDTSVIVLT